MRTYNVRLTVGDFAPELKGLFAAKPIEPVTVTVQAETDGKAVTRAIMEAGKDPSFRLMGRECIAHEVNADGTVRRIYTGK